MNERDWKKSVPKFTKAELLEIFPEVTEMIPEKLEELYREVEIKLDEIEAVLLEAEALGGSEQWFLEMYLEINQVKDLIMIEDKIKELKMFVRPLNSGYRRDFDADIRKAKEVPIYDLVSRDVELRKSGKGYIGRCPFHDDKSPSFYVYPETNSFICYGCQIKGDSIQYLMDTQNMLFVEAVNYLSGENYNEKPTVEREN